MTDNRIPVRMLVWVIVYAAAFAFVESSVVVYLRAIYYPEGFSFPLKVIVSQHLVAEVCREAATLVMLASVGIIAGRNKWQRFGYFCIAFGVWDIFYYVWLKIILGWPVSLTEWDILFLIPLPWIGPVIAALSVAFLMVLCGADIVVRTSLQKSFRPSLLSWSLSIIASALILYSFTSDSEAALYGKMPLPYHYEWLVIGLVLYLVSYYIACKPSARRKYPA